MPAAVISNEYVLIISELDYPVDGIYRGGVTHPVPSYTSDTSLSKDWGPLPYELQGLQNPWALNS